jgi:hypothetical protein
MDEEGFRDFLKKGGRSQTAIKRCVQYVRDFERFLDERKGGKGLGDAGSSDLEDFVEWIEKERIKSAKGHLWGIRYFYMYSSNEELQKLSSLLREQRIKRTPFSLKDFRGVNPEYIEKLASIGIRNVNQMLAKGKTREGRKGLLEKTGIPIDNLVELVKLSDLARIPGVKGVRARLYYDVGVDTIAKMAEWDALDFRAMVVEFVERTKFEGVATLPAEARFTIARAKELPIILEE